MTDEAQRIFTIGHSNHTAADFAVLLRRHGITAIADVRSQPYSRFSQFSRPSLEANLREVKIRYVFLGEELGARSKDLSCYEDGRVQYGRLAQTDLFRRGIERLLNGRMRFRIALMCAEREHLTCHRTILVCKVLHKIGVPVCHIHPNGSLESHDDAMLRLIDFVGLPRTHLFRSLEDLIEEACALQEARIAYVDERLVSQPAGETS